MSDWMSYHVRRILGYKVAHCERVEPERVIVTIIPEPQTLRCPRCGSQDVSHKGTNVRLLRGTPIGRIQVHFATPLTRGTRWVPLPRRTRSLSSTRITGERKTISAAIH